MSVKSELSSWSWTNHLWPLTSWVELQRKSISFELLKGITVNQKYLKQLELTACVMIFASCSVFVGLYASPFLAGGFMYLEKVPHDCYIRSNNKYRWYFQQSHFKSKSIYAWDHTTKYCHNNDIINQFHTMDSQSTSTKEITEDQR